MSMQYCENCDKNIDTDFDAEHFEECKNEIDDYNEALAKLAKALEDLNTSMQDRLSELRAIYAELWNKTNDITTLF